MRTYIHIVGDSEFHGSRHVFVDRDEFEESGEEPEIYFTHECDSYTLAGIIEMSGDTEDLMPDVLE